MDKRQIHNFAGWDQRVWDIRLLGCFYAFVDSDLWVWCQMKIFQEPDTLAIWTLRGLAQISRGAVASGSCSDCFCCNMLQPWSAVVQIHLLQYSSNFCWWDFVPAPYRFRHFPMGFLHGFRFFTPASSLRWKLPTKWSQPEGKDFSATCDGDSEFEMVMELFELQI